MNYLSFTRLTYQVSLFFLLIPPAPVAFAQAHVFQHLHVNGGLAQSTVLTIKQDKQGFMWFGTTDGLAPYDTQGFKPYRYDPANPRAISSNYITSTIRGFNDDGLWNFFATQLRLVILTSWWRTWWAYGMYLIAFGGILYVVWQFFWLRDRLRRENELQRAKLDFFTTISHEIRTNLTLIAGPIDQLLSTKTEDTEVQTELAYAKRNSDRLLRLVSELMDFRKAESSQVALHVSQNDVIPFLKNNIAAFQHLFEKRNIDLTFSSDRSALPLWFDPIQIEKVIHNLLSNAFKFMSDGGLVSISVEEKKDWVDIAIADTGCGISADNVKKLFTYYFQIYENGNQNTGYGIGLALSRSIAELHGGTLTVVSQQAQPGKHGYTCFTLRLLKGRSHFTQEQLVDYLIPDSPPTVHLAHLIKSLETILETNNRPTILLVEDNDELRGFIHYTLSAYYQITEAVNGLQGWEIAVDQIPDLIISDVMMDEMDGLELCRRLKNDERTSHIPVILLTAKADTVHQVEGLETGAVSYLTKPFNVQVLELTIRNIVTASEQLRQKYSRRIMLEPRNLVINNVDEEFIDKLIRITETRMSEPELGVDLLATEVGMSVRALYKKLKALTDMTVNDFIKSIRMKRAAQLLEQGRLNVNEVAEAVGFDRHYFSREFKKMYGLKPKQYTKTTLYQNRSIV